MERVEVLVSPKSLLCISNLPYDLNLSMLLCVVAELGVSSGGQEFEVA
jgi:hypothetical protein